MLLGRATPNSTDRYAARFGAKRHIAFFRMAQRLHISSLGIGTYLGALNDAVTHRYTEAVLTALRGGINFIDTSLNYRNQRSEQAVGDAILRVATTREFDRDEYCVCTKAGYLVPNATPAETVAKEDIAGGMHCMSPAFLADQLERSRHNLGIETIDLFYLHNPETQLGFVPREVFEDRVRAAFTALEKFVDAGKIQFYGMATWEGFRKNAGDQNALSLTRIAEIAHGIAGNQHHFRFIQLPFNLAMTEALTVCNDGKTSVLHAARDLGITVVASASILQARLSRGLPDHLVAHLPGLSTDAQRAIQFTRSTPGITTALVGMSDPAHVTENLEVARLAPLDAIEYADLHKAVR
jgi:aryl-alcohol dehydrogenase-like predicted oxidoreductase